MADAPEGQSCGLCRFYGGYERPREIGGDTVTGFCRRFPPTVTSDSTEDRDVWPSVIDEQWCGEYSPAKPQTVTEGAATLARLVLLGDLTAARALADMLKEGT